MLTPERKKELFYEAIALLKRAQMLLEASHTRMCAKAEARRREVANK